MNKLKKIALLSSAAAATVLGTGLASSPAANAAPLSAWESLAQCESGGNWSINTGNGFYGGLQFTQSSWIAAGGAGSPQNASKAEQIRVAENLLQMQGWGAWPACASKLNLYSYGTGSAPVVVEESTSQYVAPSVTVNNDPANVPVQIEASAPVASSVSVADNGYTEYTVKKGDTLSEIAYSHGFSDWKVVADFNKDTIPNSNLIEVGDVVKLPKL